MNYFCIHFTGKKHPNGLYGFHKPENCKKNPANKTGNPPASNPSAATDQEKAIKASKLKLTSDLRSVLCSELCMPDADIDKIFERAGAGN